VFVTTFLFYISPIFTGKAVILFIVAPRLFTGVKSFMIHAPVVKSGAMTLGIMTLSIIPLSINDTKHKGHSAQ
jgi:hypothetical protein